MKKWLPAIFILAAALIFFGVISLPHTGLPHSRAEALQWDEGHRQMTAEESEALDERLAGVKFNIRASGSTTLYMEHITVFFDDRKAQTILYCMEDDAAFEKANDECATLISAAGLEDELLSARSVLKAAEDRLIAYGLSLAPAGVRATLEKAVQHNAATRAKVLDLAFRLDVSTVRA